MESHPVEKKDIIIKCKLAEMVRQFFKDYVIVWHDPHLNSQENLQYRVQLERFCPVQTFTEWDKASSYIKGTKQLCHVITSGMNGEFLVKEIDSKENVSNIYVFCRNEDYHSTWTKNYAKIACIETDISLILNQIQQKLLEFYKQSSSLTFNLPAFAPIFNDSHKSKMNHLHRYLRAFPNFKNREQAKEDFIALSRGIYSDQENKSEIANFERNYNEYNMGSILKWYTRNGFFFRVTNNSLRIATSDSIQYCRFPLKDLERAIKEQYQLKSKNFNGELYRGAYLSQEEWSNLKDNVSREIEMHGFMSVSKEKKVGMNFVKGDMSAKVFITIVVPKGPNNEEQGFADLDEFSEFSMEKEVLFNVRSRFTVLETEEEYSKQLRCRHLVLLYGAQSFKKFIAEKNPIQEIIIPESFSCTLCKTPSAEIDGNAIFIPLTNSENNKTYYCKGCLSKPKEAAPLLCAPLINDPSSRVASSFKAQIKGFKLMINDSQIPFYGYRCSKCQAKQQNVYFKCTCCDKGKNILCENCFENSSDCIRLGHSIILENSPFSFWSDEMSHDELNHLNVQNELVLESYLFQQAQTYEESHEYEKAIEYYKTYINENRMNSQDKNLATCYANAGRNYFQKGEYQEAMEYFLKSLDIRKLILEENHPEIAESYNNIGLVYEHQGEYQKALEYHFKSLDIENLVFGKIHPRIAGYYNNIGMIYEHQGEYQKALEYLFKSLDIRKLAFGDDHPDTAHSYHNIGRVYSSQREAQKALEYFLKSLDIRKVIFGENHPRTTDCYQNIGVVYENEGEYQKALEYFLKSLDIMKLTLEKNHSDFATVYNNIGVAYYYQGEYQKAMKYFSESLEIRKLVFGENHPHIAASYNNIGGFYMKQGAYQKALDCFLKSLDIRKFAFGENHLEIADSYHNIGVVYENQGDYQKASEYYLKCLDIEKLHFAENHPRIAACYDNIVALYHKQGDFRKVLEFSLKIVMIRKLASEKNHPNTHP